MYNLCRNLFFVIDMFFFVVFSYWKKFYLICLVCILFVKKNKMLGGICDKNLSVLNDDLNSYLIIEKVYFLT